MGYFLESLDRIETFKDLISQKWKPWRKAISVQRQTLAALIFREAKTRFGEQSLGILWAFGEALMHIFVMWVIWSIFGRHNYSGLPIPVFLVTGLLPFFMFRNCFEKTSNCISGNQSLLVFSQINILDFALARCILETVIYGAAFFIFMTMLYFFEYEFVVKSASHIIWGFMNAWFFGMGLGLLYLPLRNKFKIIDTIVPLILRALYFLSGAIFPIDKLPYSLIDYLEYNPLLHIITYIRNGFIEDYGYFDNISYSFECAIFCIMIGLILMQRLRRMILDND